MPNRIIGRAEWAEMDGVRLALQDREVIERDENLLPYVDMNTVEAMPILDAFVGMMIQAVCRNAK